MFFPAHNAREHMFFLLHKSRSHQPSNICSYLSPPSRSFPNLPQPSSQQPSNICSPSQPSSQQLPTQLAETPNPARGRSFSSLFAAFSSSRRVVSQLRTQRVRKGRGTAKPNICCFSVVALYHFKVLPLYHFKVLNYTRRTQFVHKTFVYTIYGVQNICSHNIQANYEQCINWSRGLTVQSIHKWLIS